MELSGVSSDLKGGYPVEWFVNPVSEDLNCSICWNVLNDPQQCKNGHCFCRFCITDALKRREVCPTCNIKLILNDLGSSLLAQKQIRKLQIRCRSSGDLCLWQGTIDELQQHLKQDCYYRLVPCPLRAEPCLVCESSENSQIGNHIISEHLQAHINALKNTMITKEELNNKIAELERIHANKMEELVTKQSVEIEKIKTKNQRNIERITTIHQSEIESFTNKLAESQGLVTELKLDLNDVQTERIIGNDYYGVKYFANGDVYSGAFEYGIPHGIGRLITKSGTTKIGSI